MIRSTRARPGGTAAPCGLPRGRVLQLRGLFRCHGRSRRVPRRHRRRRVPHGDWSDGSVTVRRAFTKTQERRNRTPSIFSTLTWKMIPTRDMMIKVLLSKVLPDQGTAKDAAGREWWMLLPGRENPLREECNVLWEYPSSGRWKDFIHPECHFQWHNITRVNEQTRNLTIRWRGYIQELQISCRIVQPQSQVQINPCFSNDVVVTRSVYKVVTSFGCSTFRLVSLRNVKSFYSAENVNVPPRTEIWIFIALALLLERRTNI